MALLPVRPILFRTGEIHTLGSTDLLAFCPRYETKAYHDITRSCKRHVRTNTPSNLIGCVVESTANRKYGIVVASRRNQLACRQAHATALQKGRCSCKAGAEYNSVSSHFLSHPLCIECRYNHTKTDRQRKTMLSWLRYLKWPRQLDWLRSRSDWTLATTCPRPKMR